MKATLFLSAALVTAAMLGASPGPAQVAQQGTEVDLTAEELAALGVERVRRIVVYGDEPCPESSAEEIVVCARLPDNERYRIPEPLRDDPAELEEVSWAARAQQLEYVGDSGINSCSTSGPAGHTGCWAEMMRQWREERRQAGDTP